MDFRSNCDVVFRSEEEVDFRSNCGVVNIHQKRMWISEVIVVHFVTVK